MRSQRILPLLVVAAVGMMTPTLASANPSPAPATTQLVTGLEGGSGSTVGPGGALYVTESAVGRISRVDPSTGEVTTFASGLPELIVDVGGAMDVAFIGETAYALVTVVGPDVGGSDVVGIYRVDGPDSFTVVADIGAFSFTNPPGLPILRPTGVQYALETYRGGFLVTDGHHNRVLRVTLNGEITEVIAFGNIVPTGLAMTGQHGLHGRGRSGSAPARGRQGRGVQASRRAPRRWPRAGGCSWTWSSAAVARSTPSRRASSSPATPGFSGRRRTPAALVKVNGRRHLQRPSSTNWTGRPRSSSSGTPRTSSRSPARSGRSRTSRVRPTTGCTNSAS